MAVAFQPSQEVVRGDLDIFLTNNQGNPTDPAEITYAIYYLDPGPVEVLIGSANRVPVNPAVGEYFAALMIPSGATVGTYRIRWTFRELVNSPLTQVVQEFAVVGADSAVVVSPYTASEQEMIDTLRILLRDNCVGEEETVELDVDGERMVVRMDDLWDTLKDLTPTTD